MCGRYVLVDGQKLIKRFEVSEKPEGYNFEANYNAAPSQLMPVITRNSPNKLQLMKWGLVPVWAKDPKIGFSMINARAETLLEKRTFSVLMKKHRVIIPANGFYEWKKTENGKVPYYFKLKSGELFGFAGLASVWKDAEGRELHTYAIITTTPNELVTDVHDRMPVILRPEDEDKWLDQEVPPEATVSFLAPYPADKMVAYGVSSEVNSVRNNDEGLIEPYPTYQ